MKGKRVLVTGGSGFIGLNLVKRLISDGESVTCLVRETTDLTELRKLDCRLVTSDLLQPGPALVSAVQGQDVVYHLAARTKLSRNNR